MARVLDVAAGLKAGRCDGPGMEQRQQPACMGSTWWGGHKVHGITA